MKIVAGLGNPGSKYAGTRHNVGFEVIESLRSRLGADSPSERFRSRLSMGFCGSEKVLLLEPQTYMNLSGEALGEAARYYKVEPEDVIVVHDDVDLEAGRVKVKSKGGAGGHRGLLSIFQHYGKDFARVRVGVGRPGAGRETSDHVLSRFAPDDKTRVEDAIQRAAEAVECIVREDVKAAMNRFNTSAKDGGDKNTEA